MSLVTRRSQQRERDTGGERERHRMVVFVRVDVVRDQSKPRFPGTDTKPKHSLDVIFRVRWIRHQNIILGRVAALDLGVKVFVFVVDVHKASGMEVPDNRSRTEVGIIDPELGLP